MMKYRKSITYWADFLLTRSWWLQLVLNGVTIIVIGGVLGGIYLLPLYRDYQTARNFVTNRLSLVEDKRQQLQNLQAALAASMTKPYCLTRQYLDDIRESFSHYTALMGSIKRTDVKLQTLQHLSVQKESMLTIHQWQLGLVGSYSQLMSYLSHLSTDTTYQITMLKLVTRGELLELDIIVYRYELFAQTCQEFILHGLSGEYD